MKYDGVIFDKDGVLIDSMSDGFEWADSIRASYYSTHKVDLNMANKVLYVQKSDALQHMLQNQVPLQRIKEAEQAVSQRKIQRIISGEIPLFDGVENVLQSINLPKAVVSNASLEATRFTMKHHGLDKYFEMIEAPPLDDIQRYIQIKKPNTHMVSKVMRKTGMRNPLMVGDTSDDILVARNAGIDCCLVKGHKDYSELNPRYSINHIRELPDILN